MSLLPPGTLVSHCVSCLGSLGASKGVTLSTAVDSFIASVPSLARDEVAAETLRQCVYGVQRCKQMLAVTVDGLYSRHASSVARSDRALYELFTWLLVFGLSTPRTNHQQQQQQPQQQQQAQAQLSLSEFRRFVLSQEPHKMHTLLSFLCDEEMQSTWLLEQWSGVYDHAHVQSVLLGGLRDADPQLKALISELAAKLAHASSSAANDGPVEVGMVGVTRVARKESTVPEPFALTQPKVRMLPAPPIMMSATYKAGAIPPAVYNNSLSQLEAEAAQRRNDTNQAVARRHAEARPPSLSTHARSQTTHTSSTKLRAELEAKELAATQAVFKPRPAPQVRSVKSARSTTAAILREDLLYKRRQEEEKAALAKFESELRDEADFHAWQLRMEALDNLAKEKEVAARKVAAALAQAEAVQAMQAHAAAKHAEVVSMRAELAAITAARDEARQRIVEEKQQHVAKVTEAKAAIPIAVAEVARRKVELAEQIQAEKERAAREKKKAAAADLVQKKALIKQIQAMEQLANARAKRAKVVDPTATSGLGLLDEMSLVELQKRQTLSAEREEAFLAEKRSRILQAKSAKAEVLEGMQRNAARMRKDMRAEQEEKRDAKVVAAEIVARKAEAKLATESIVLQQRQAESQELRRREALRLVQELKAKKIQNDFYASAKAGLARQRSEDLARAAARVEQTQAVRGMEESKAAELVRYEAEKNRIRAEKARKRERLAVRAAAENTLQQHRVDGQQMAEEDAHLKALQRREIAQAVAAQVENQRARNPYAKAIAEREARRAARLAKVAARQADRQVDQADDLFASGSEGEGDDGDADALAADAHEERLMRKQVAALSFGDDDDDEEEEAKQQQHSDSAAAAAAAAAPSSSTIKRASAAASAGRKSSGAGRTLITAAKPVPLAAH
jgi:hypothetical protein